MGKKVINKGENEKWGFSDLQGRTIQQVTLKGSTLVLELSSKISLKVAVNPTEKLHVSILAHEMRKVEIEHPLEMHGTAKHG
jgi:hypothetical protein